MRAALALLAVTLAAQTPSVRRDIPYAQPVNPRNLLDIHSPPNPSNLPVVVWIHGGGWMRGSKDNLDSKPAAFTSRGFLLVAINYRFIPQVTMEDIVRDAARATGWVHDNIARHGGDPTRLFLMGHSAGAQLAALLCTDASYLKAERVPLQHIKGCVPVDGDTYDVPLQVATDTARRKGLHQPAPKMGHPEKFGNLERQRALSAVNHVAPNRGIPPFLLIHVDDHTDTSAQAYRLWAALDQARIPATLFGAPNSEHVRLNVGLGAPGDPATAALFDFTSRCLRPSR